MQNSTSSVNLPPPPTQTHCVMYKKTNVQWAWQKILAASAHQLSTMTTTTDTFYSPVILKWFWDIIGVWLFETQDISYSCTTSFSYFLSVQLILLCGFHSDYHHTIGLRLSDWHVLSKLKGRVSICWENHKTHQANRHLLANYKVQLTKAWTQTFIVSCHMQL